MIVDTKQIIRTIDKTIEYLCTVAKRFECQEDHLESGSAILIRDQLIYVKNQLAVIQKQLDKERPQYKIDDSNFRKLLKQRIGANGRLLLDSILTDLLDCTIIFEGSE